jgi:hypothetical protein
VSSAVSPNCSFTVSHSSAIACIAYSPALPREDERKTPTSGPLHPRAVAVIVGDLD